jgi:hypothetical protein
VCGGLVGTWTKWCLDWRDPFAWVVLWLLEGRRAWTRPALISYWGALAAISVAGWSRQLSRARRHRRYVVPGVRESGSSAHSHGNAHGHGHGHGHGQGHGHAHGHGHNAPSQAGATHSHDGGDVSGLSGVASQMMDAADQRMPTLSVNARRKFFHALAVVMFVPGIAVDVSDSAQALRFPVRDGFRSADNASLACLHAPVVLRRFCRLHICRIHPLLCPLAFWGQRPSLPQRVSRLEGLGHGDPQPFLPARGMRLASVARGAERNSRVLWRPVTRRRGRTGFNRRQESWESPVVRRGREDCGR